MAEVTCAICDARFIPPRANGKYCGRDCYLESNRRRANARYAPVKAANPKFCAGCGDRLAHRGATWCSTACRPKRVYGKGKRVYDKGECSADGCTRGVLARGMCPTHYSAWHRQEHGRGARSDRQFTIVCAFCGEQAEVSKASAQCCSQQCAQRLRSGWSASREVVRWSPMPTATEKLCTAQLGTRARNVWAVDSSGTVRRRGGSTQPRLWVAGSCRRCGDPFVIVDQTRNRYCSQRCARSDAAARRRARKKNAYVADVCRLDIFERDRWRCQICGCRVAKTKVVPHPKAPTIDHIVPLDAGGDHEPKNVQLAHNICNTRKGAGAANDQLRLIG